MLYPVTSRKIGDRLKIAHYELSHAFKRSDLEALGKFKQELERESQNFDKVIISSEDFQNLMETGLIGSFFEDYEITTVCYLREIVSYSASSFAQHIHHTHFATDFLAHSMKHVVNLPHFTDKWAATSHKSTFKLYQRDQLKNADIVEDFAEIAGINPDLLQQAPTNANPSLSGNLLALKILMNLTGLSNALTYKQLGDATKLSTRFRGKIYVSTEHAHILRKLTPYNAYLKATFENFAEDSFDTGNKVFCAETWEEDMNLLMQEGYLDKLSIHPLFKTMLARQSIAQQVVLESA